MMKNKTTLKIVDGGVLELWVDKIEKEFINILDNSDHVQNWLKTIDRDKVKITIKTVTMTSYMQEEIMSMKRLTKTALKQKFYRFAHMEANSIFTMRTFYTRGEDGLVYVKGCTLFVRTAPLLADISLYLKDLDYMWKLHRWLLHHEVGHFIDHIVNDNGITVEESNRRIDETQENYEKHYKWLKEYEKEPGFSPDTVNRAYYNIPSEARANEYGGIDVEEMIKIKNEHNAKIGNKAVTVSVDIVDIEDKPNKE
jgi:hypothetical protein